MPTSLLDSILPEDSASNVGKRTTRPPRRARLPDSSRVVRALARAEEDEVVALSAHHPIRTLIEANRYLKPPPPPELPGSPTAEQLYGTDIHERLERLGREGIPLLKLGIRGTLFRVRSEDDELGIDRVIKGLRHMGLFKELTTEEADWWWCNRVRWRGVVLAYADGGSTPRRWRTREPKRHDSIIGDEQPPPLVMSKTTKYAPPMGLADQLIHHDAGSWGADGAGTPTHGVGIREYDPIQAEISREAGVPDEVAAGPPPPVSTTEWEDTLVAAFRRNLRRDFRMGGERTVELAGLVGLSPEMIGNLRSYLTQAAGQSGLVVGETPNTRDTTSMG